MTENQVRGRCPRGCGETLFLGKGGYITCSFDQCPEPDAASNLLTKEPDRKITLHAVYRKSGHLDICDQHGRKFDATDQNAVLMGQKPERVILEVSLNAAYWPQVAPRAEIKISVPLEVEERLPEYLREILEPRSGIAIVGWMP